ncbi:hypothetical protein GGGNBK_12865 [Sporosarcina sp. ANT_H38]|uniref:hypothetical protein n=1 Tax=Sporosarcina sp. ANT_H38 TaxID=2597358 RepID=UPI0021038B04|nr:hypothetical protein [Sporosarcina sp. ANT_H38]
MPLEEGGIDWLIGGFSIVTGLVLLILLLLLFKNKTSRSAYVWTILHLLLLSVAF